MKSLRRVDLATLSGLLLAAAALYVGLHMEGLHLGDISQATAALIVFAGTAGAVLISTPSSQTKLALRALPSIFSRATTTHEAIIGEIMALSRAGRARGLISLEQDLDDIKDPFLQKGLRLTVDGVSAETVEAILTADLESVRTRSETVAGFYETGAGYAPSLGIAGAAIGLIQVMKHLDRLEQVGAGVSAAFVATIYGVLFANLVLLPIATKIRTKGELRYQACTLMKHGVAGIASGLNPWLLRTKLETLVQEPSAKREDRLRSVAA